MNQFCSRLKTRLFGFAYGRTLVTGCESSLVMIDTMRYHVRWLSQDAAAYTAPSALLRTLDWFATRHNGARLWSRSRGGLETYQRLVSVSSWEKLSTSRFRLGLGHLRLVRCVNGL